MDKESQAKQKVQILLIKGLSKMLPQLNRINKAETYISVFRGLNKTENTGFSTVASNNSSIYTEFKDMQNLSSRNYPQLSPREPRSRFLKDKKIISNLVAVNSGLIYIDEDGNLNYNGETYEIENIDLSVEHNLVTFGNNIIILPDNLIFSLEDKKFNFINRVNDKSTCIFGTKLVDYDWIFSELSIEKVDLKTSGKPYSVRYIVEHNINFTDTDEQKKQNGSFKYENLFKNIKVGDTVENISAFPSILYRCTSIEDAKEADLYIDNKIRNFIIINDYYVKIKVNSDSLADGFGVGINIGDFIKITGMEKNKHNLDDYKDSNDSWGDYYDILNDHIFKVYFSSPREIIIKAPIETSVAYNGKITVERVKPDSDYDKCIEVNNRLWTCSSENNEIYACKQGDAANWQSYSDGIATDSFAMTVGCEGEFTGIARQNDSVIFFKENWILKIYGTKPSNYSLASYNVLGVERGSSKSVVWINGILYYLSSKGVCRYSPGGQPEIISDYAFGTKKYKNAVAGRHENKYYISAQNENEEYELFVFDTETGFWHKEDNTHMLSTVTYNNTLYYIDSVNGSIMAPNDKDNLISSGTDFQQEGAFDWSCETGDLYDNDFNSKYISKISVGIKSEQKTKVKIQVQFKDGGQWVELKSILFNRKMPHMLPVPVRRSDFLKLRILGTGQCNIYGIKIEFAQGSEIRHGSI